MRRRIYKPRWGMPKDSPEPLGVRVSVALVLLNVFIWIGLRHLDMLLLSLASFLMAAFGWLLARRALKRIRRYQGRVSGEHMAAIGYWGNCLFLIGSFFLLAYRLVIFLIRGDFI